MQLVHSLRALRWPDIFDDHGALDSPSLRAAITLPVACDDHPVVADQHWIDEAELGDRSRDPRDLLVGIVNIARTPGQPLERPWMAAGMQGQGDDQMMRPISSYSRPKSAPSHQFSCWSHVMAN